MTSLTKACTMLPKAAPITMPTARSTTFPRRRNFLNPPSSLLAPRTTPDARAAPVSFSDDM